MPPIRVPTGAQLEAEGEGLGGERAVQSIQVNLLGHRVHADLEGPINTIRHQYLPMLWANWSPSKICMLKSQPPVPQDVNVFGDRALETGHRKKTDLPKPSSGLPASSIVRKETSTV